MHSNFLCWGLGYFSPFFPCKMNLYIIIFFHCFVNCYVFFVWSFMNAKNEKLMRNLSCTYRGGGAVAIYFNAVM